MGGNTKDKEMGDALSSLNNAVSLDTQEDIDVNISVPRSTPSIDKLHQSFAQFKNDQYRVVNGKRLGTTDDDRNFLLMHLDRMTTHDVGRVGKPRENDAAYASLRTSGSHFFSKLRAVQSKFSTDRVFVGNQLLWYRAKDLVGISAIFTLTGTIFWSKFMWFQVAFLIVLMHVVTGLIYLTSYLIENEKYNEIEPMLFANSFSYINQLLTFLLGFYVTTTIGRWWSVRTSGEDGLWNALNNIFMLVGAYTPKKTETALQYRVEILRLAMLSHRLIFMQARGEVDLSDLVDDGLLLPLEKPLLEDRPAKAMIVWGWLTRHINDMVRSGVVQGVAEGPLLTQVMNGRTGIQTIFTFLDCQLPLPYTHIVCLLVKVFLLISACEFGIRFGLSLIKISVLTGFWNPAHPVWVWTLCMFQLVCYSFFYQGMIDLQQLISDPFGTDQVDFPYEAYQHFLREEGIGLLEGAMEMRDARRKAKDENDSGIPAVLRPRIDPEVEKVLDTLDYPQFKELFAAVKMDLDTLCSLQYPGMPGISAPP